MGFGLFDGADDGEHTGLGFVGIFSIFAMQDAFFFRMTSLDRCKGHTKLFKDKSLTANQCLSCSYCMN